MSINSWECQKPLRAESPNQLKKHHVEVYTHNLLDMRKNKHVFYVESLTTRLEYNF